MKTETSKILLPRTGQATSYATGDDGYFQAGNPRATRFVDNGNGTITDRATGLQWVKDPGAIGGAFGSAGAPLQMTWAAAVANCLGADFGGSLAYAGFSDWRLPNLWEGLSVADFSNSSGPPSPFFGGAEQFWSSTSQDASNAYKYYECRVSYLAYKEAITTGRYVRPVRGGRVNKNG